MKAYPDLQTGYTCTESGDYDEQNIWFEKFPELESGNDFELKTWMYAYDIVKVCSVKVLNLVILKIIFKDSING